MEHDQLFKELFTEFLPEFLELFFPGEAALLDLSQISFLDKEAFTDVAGGTNRIADIVAEIATRTGEPGVLLLQVEVERQRRLSFGQRMWEYFAVFWLRYGRPVFPIVVYLSPGAGGIVVETFGQNLLGHPLLRFQYFAVGLPDLNADEWRDRPNPLAPALAALMRSAQVGRLHQKYEALTRIAQSGENDARKVLLSNTVETYLNLSEADDAELRRLLLQNASEVQEMISVYEERGVVRGIEQGVVRGKQDSLLRLLALKFGPLPEAIMTRIQTVNNADELDALTDRVLFATSLTDMGLMNEGPNPA